MVLILKNGIFSARTPSIYSEEHGGGKIEHISYAHLIIKNNTSGIYFSGPKWYKPYFDTDIIDLKGKITVQKEDFLAFYILNPYTKENILFSGTVHDSGKLLKLKAYNESTPDIIWINDDFVWVDIDYEGLETN